MWGKYNQVAGVGGVVLRVLYVNPMGALGGAERSLLDVLVSFEQTDVQIERQLLLMGGGELEKRARALGLEVRVLPMPPALAQAGESRQLSAGGPARFRELAAAAAATLGYVRALRRAILETRPDVIHTNGMKAHVLAQLAAPELPRVIHLRDFASARPVTRHLLRQPFGRALFVTNSRAVATDLVQVIPKARARVVYNAIDLVEFAPGAASSRLAELAELPPPAPGSVVIGMLATYAWWKGHRLFLAAAARLRSLTRVPCRVYVIGGPIYGGHGSQLDRAELERLVREAGLSGEVGLVPFQHDVAPLYRELDIVVHPSERPEPFGRTIAEGMASGKPVVVSRAGGAAELFVEGESGLGFTLGDDADCARVLATLVEDGALRERLGRAARLEAEQRFDRARLARDLHAVYAELLG